MIIAPKNSSTIQAFYRKTYRPLRLLGRAQSTADQYAITMLHWTRYVGDMPIDEIDDLAVARFAQALLAKGQRAPTVNKNLRHLGIILRFAAAKGEIEAVPEIPKLKENLAMPRAFLLEEVSAILAAAREVQGSLAGVVARDWWTSLLLTLYDCGGRIGAVLATSTINLDIQSGWIMLPPESQKQRRGQDLRLHPDTVAACQRIWDADRAMMWPWPYGRCVIFRHYRRILKAAGVETWRGTGCLFHRIRKSCASYSAANGLDPVVQMGHSSAAVTARYLDERIIGRTHAADVLPRPKF